MPRNQWSRRKRSTKPEETIPGETPAEDADGRPPQGGRAGSSPRKIAFDILARREHSVFELREKLLAREFPPDEVEQTLDALIADGLLSEQRFIDSFLASYTRRGHGPLWLRAELERRGIAGAQVAEQARDRPVVLCGQHLGGCEQHGLPAAVDDGEHGSQRHDGLTGAHLALE